MKNKNYEIGAPPGGVGWGVEFCLHSNQKSGQNHLLRRNIMKWTGI